jgi:hypothetical protein
MHGPKMSPFNNMKEVGIRCCEGVALGLIGLGNGIAVGDFKGSGYARFTYFPFRVDPFLPVKMGTESLNIFKL